MTTLCKTALQRTVALIPSGENLLDHLGVMAAILDIPLIVSEEKLASLAAALYPQIKTIFMEWSDDSLKYLAENYDTLFVTSKGWAVELYLTLPLFFKKTMRVVYCPHGNSDKGHSLNDEITMAEDISLIYGDHMRDLLRDTGMLKKINLTIETGNFRHSFFREHQSFYEAQAQKLVFAKLDRRRKTVFYAPTWHSQENPTSFFNECKALIDQITPSFNLLIKVHPLLFEQHPAQTYSIVEKHREHPQVLFLEEFPPIYPLLSLSDIYLGDFSSIGYDFLTFDKPMYFFNPAKTNLKKDRGHFLHQCGMEITTQGSENVFAFIKRTLEQNQTEFSPLRKKIYHYTFGAERTLSQVRKEIVRKFI
jgi:hypothetical protein